MKVKHVIVDTTGGKAIIDKIRRQGVVSMVSIGDYTILGRYGTSKTTLKKILKAWFYNDEE